MIAAFMARCQGRIGRSPLGATLCEQCTDCQRRTAIEPDRSYNWMQPPSQVWPYTQFCSGYIGPEIETQEDVC